MFKYLKTCFNLIAGLIDEDVLIIVALVVALLLALWIVLSLVTCKELKIAKNSKKLAKLIDENGLTEDTEPEVIAIVSKMPKQIGTAFRLTNETVAMMAIHCEGKRPVEIYIQGEERMLVV